MKIALVMFNRNWGGAENYCGELCSGFEKNGIEAELIYICKNRLPKVVFETRWNKFLLMKDLENSADYLNSFDAILFVTMGFWRDRYEEPYYSSLVQKIKKPIYGVVHGPYDMDYYTHWQEVDWSGIFFPKFWMKDWFSGEFETDAPMHTIHLPVDLADDQEKFHPANSEVLDSCGPRNIDVLSASRVEWSKYVHKLTEIADQIDGNIAIHGNADGRYLWGIKKDLKPNVEIFGRYAFDDKELIFSKAKVVIDFSKHRKDAGTAQYVELDGMKYGCVPFVRSHWIGHFVENVNVVSFDTWSNMPKALNGLLADKEKMYRIATENFKFLRGKHDSKKIAKQYMDVML